MFTKTEIAVGAGVPITFSAAAIGAVHFFVATPDTGDVLSFIGALFGAASAVAGAIYVEERRRRKNALDEQQPILDAITGLRHAVQGMRAQSTLGEIDKGAVEEAATVLWSMYEHYPPRTPRLLIGRDALDNALTHLRQLYVDARREGAYYPDRPMKEDVRNAVNRVDVSARQLADAHRRIK